MKVALLTSWNERCGIAEYAKNLVAHAKNTEFTILGREVFESSNAINGLPHRLCGEQTCIVHVNYEPGLLHILDANIMHQFRGAGIKSVMTLHTTGSGINRNTLIDSFNRVVVHEKTGDNYDYIPLGAIKMKLEDKPAENKIGTAGFPFPWKGFHQVAQASKKLGMGCLVVAPESDHFKTEVMEKFVRDAQPEVEYVKDWLTEEQVISRLSECAVNVFAYDGANNGISGAVRFGISAQRPLVVTRCRQFRDLFDYEEVEVINSQSPDEIIVGVQNALAKGKKPERVLEDMSWDKAAERYESIYKELLA